MKFVNDEAHNESERLAEERGWAWDVQLVTSPDAVLSRASETQLIATADSAILGKPVHWIDLPGEVIRRAVPGVWMLDLS